MNDLFSTDKLVLTRETLTSGQMVEHEIIKSNTRKSEFENHMMMAHEFRFETYFFTRQLKEDYVFRHPASLWQLFIWFLLAPWPKAREKFVVWKEHKITVKEAYNNLSIPKGQPIVYVDRFLNGKSIIQ